MQHSALHSAAMNTKTPKSVQQTNDFRSTSSDVTRNVLKSKLILQNIVTDYQITYNFFSQKLKLLFSLFFFLGSGHQCQLQTRSLRTNEIWPSNVNTTPRIILLDSTIGDFLKTIFFSEFQSFLTRHFKNEKSILD